MSSAAAPAAVPARRILVIGGSGFLSGCLVRHARRRGWRTWIVTRGRRPVPRGVVALRADRDDPRAFGAAIRQAGVRWDVVVDCLGLKARHGRQDARVFAGRARHLLLVSSDAVYAPLRRRVPQPADAGPYAAAGYGRDKLECERALRRCAGDRLPWTILRPGHIYGPGAALGCVPEAFRDERLPERILAGRTLRLAAGGRLRHQPIYVDDLARLLLSLANRRRAHGQVFNVPGCGTPTMLDYYEALASALHRRLRVREIPAEECRRRHPRLAVALAERVVDPAPLAASGAAMPRTSLRQGMKCAVRAWRAARSRR